MPNYGKVKVNTLTYDSSGSAVDLAVSNIAVKADPTFTGTITAAALTLSGDLTVNGTTTTVASANTTIADNLLELNSGASSNANDSGIIIERGSTGDNAIIAWDESNDKFVVGTTTATASSTGNITIATGTLLANVEGSATQVVGVSNGSDTAYRVPFLSADSGAASVYTDLNSGMTYNPSTNLLYVAGSFEDSKGDVRRIPQESKSSAYTVATADAGKHIYISTGGVTFPSGGLAVGQAITLINNSSSDQTITCSAITMYLAGDTTAKTSLTLKGRAMATFLCAATGSGAANVYYGSGAGLE